jgi:acyl-coenzyme A synthetase/AMP-(fatty) acid ligase
VEDAYYEHPDVKHAAVVTGQQGKVEAFVELLQGSTVTPDKVAEFVAARVTEGLMPSQTTLVDEMPRSFSGKADRRRLEQQLV